MRAITKKFASCDTIISVLTMKGDFETIKIPGKRLSERAAEAYMKKKLGTSNFAIAGVEHVGNAEERTYSLPAERFIENAKVCVEGETYGHDCVTTTVKITQIQYRCVDNPKQIQIAYYPGVTTMSKLRKFLTDGGVKKFVICGQPVTEVRYYMGKDEFIALCESTEK